MSRVITTIPATIGGFSSEGSPIGSTKRRVAGYARVSTDKEDQFSSYEAQVDYYTNYIKSRSDWEFVDIYTDEGLSGTRTVTRPGFMKMVADAMDGKIDLIITKSISRFARNTVDSLTTIRDLKSKNVECYFEKENIWTFDGKGELLITIMSSLAQEESRSISENITWGQRKRFADGKASVAFGRFLGYDRGPNGEFVINEEEAKVVRLIYMLYLEGKTHHLIAKILTDKGIPTPGKKKKWADSTVKSILQNEKYAGDALLQKSYTTNYLTGETKMNEGEIPQYYVKNNHDPIIDREIFDLVQAEVARRKGKIGRYNNERLFTGKLICGNCGDSFCPRTREGARKQPYVVWFCTAKERGESLIKCNTGRFCDASIKDMFIHAVNQIPTTDMIEAQKLVNEVAFNTDELEWQQRQVKLRLDDLASQMDLYIAQNTRIAQNQDIYNQEYAELSVKFTEAKDYYEKLTATIKDKKLRKFRANQYYTRLKSLTYPIDRIDHELWLALVDHVLIKNQEDITFVFMDGSTMKIGYD